MRLPQMLGLLALLTLAPLIAACPSATTESNSPPLQTQAAVSAAVSTSPAGDCKPQLRAGAKIMVPEPSVREELRAWSGLYGGGRWDNVMCTSLAVLRVNADGTAQVQYVHGTAAVWEINRPAAYSYVATIKGSELSFTIPALNNVRVVYTRNGDEVQGLWIRPDGVELHTTLLRVKNM